MVLVVKQEVNCHSCHCQCKISNHNQFESEEDYNIYTCIVDACKTVIFSVHLDSCLPDTAILV